ncbi:MAG: DUF4861 domain-containing protein [Prevotella sp.]
MNMKRITILTALAATTMAASSQIVKEVTVANNSKLARTVQPVAVNISESDNIKSATVTLDGKEIPCQLDDMNGNGINDQLFFITSLEKKQEKKFTVSLSQDISTNAFEPQVYAEMLLTNKKIKSENKQDLYISSLTVDNGTNPYWMLHHHGPAFENEMVAYRIYFDERQTVDIYGKYNKGLELKQTQFYPDQSQKDAGMGDDVLWVGKTFGLGALRGWADNAPQMLQDVDKRTLSIVARGPLRTVVKVEDRGWNVAYPAKCDAKERIDMTTLYTLCAGRRDCMVDITFTGNLSGKCFATGIINVKGSEEYTDGKGLRGCWGTDWPVSAKDSVGHKRETVGLGICIPSSNIVSELPANKDNYPYVVAPTAASLHYAITFASDNETFEGSYHNSEAFFNYLKQWKKEMEQPINISIKDVSR